MRITRPTFSSLLAFTCLCSLTILSGCGIAKQDLATSGVAERTAMRGKVFGGQQPISGATVTAWQPSTQYYGDATAIASVTTGQDGSFDFAANPYPCPANDTPIYVTATGGDAGFGTNSSIALAAGLADCATAQNADVNINEVTTVVTAFALQGFYPTFFGPGTLYFSGPATNGGTNNAAFVIANSYTIPMLVDLPSGVLKPSTGLLNFDAAKIYSLANTLAACVNTSGVTGPSDTTSPCARLFANASPPHSDVPTTTLEAVIQIARFPYLNVEPLYNIAPAISPFAGLGGPPNDWSIGISYTSAAFGLAIAGTSTSSTSSNIDIDASGKIWFPTNSATSHGLAYFDPASTTFNGPYATFLKHGQYLAVTDQDLVYGTDLAGQFLLYVDASAPSTIFGSKKISGPAGPIFALTPAPNQTDTIYFAGAADDLGSQQVTFFSYASGSVSSLINFAQPPDAMTIYFSENVNGLSPVAATSGDSSPCSLEAPVDGVVFGSAAPCVAGGVLQTASDFAISASTSQLCVSDTGTCSATGLSLSKPKALAEDGYGHSYAANAGNSSVSEIDVTGTGFLLHDLNHGGTMTQPYGMAIDGAGNIWVSNAGCVDTTGSGCTPGPFVLSELLGAAFPTITPLAKQTSSDLFGNFPTQVSPVVPHLPARRIR